MLRNVLVIGVVLLCLGIGAGVAEAGKSVGVAATANKVPNVTNLALPAAEHELRKDGIGYRTKGGGIFGIILKSDWGVCAQIPRAGSVVRGKVELVVGHFTCGA